MLFLYLSLYQFNKKHYGNQLPGCRTRPDLGHCPDPIPDPQEQEGPEKIRARAEPVRAEA
ncbi:hypothetical protein [Pedobacter panaciterrae]|jgi:hypothetical protein|uniref:Uncharacterized protein n=1 Tax=Pedobacter panaciterrae TaxID=363849 RepID=A0ABU8NMF9_9SPHI|nr:hypothetical protein [Pedobacter panaciterrae]NQX53064.1 hypothetical protein [Pedobacter panaciterrae]